MVISSQRKGIKILKTNIEFLKRILDNVDELFFLIEGTKVSEINKKAKEYFGECVGADIFDLLILEKGNLLVDAVHDGEGKDVVEFEDKVFSSKKGGWFFFRVRYLKDVGVLILKDKTQEKYLHDTKMNMSVLIAHELKNPIGVISSAVSELMEEEEDISKIEILARVQKNIERLSRIIQQIEYITMAQLGVYTPKVEKIDVRKLVELVVDDLEGLINTKRIEVLKEIKVDFLNGDQFILRTILRNLLSNALKYSFENSKVIVEITKDYLSVRDFGVGIPDEELPRIFERFYRTPTGVRMSTGSGLGLAVVKHLSNLASYKVEVESQHMIGTKFTVYFNK